LIPFLDLASDFAEVEPEARRRIDGVLAGTQYVLGSETAGLEQAMRERLGCAAAVAVSSGSDALSLALLAFGIGRGDAVIVPSFTFFATAGAVVHAGAIPVFCDIDRATFMAGEHEIEAAIAREFVADGASLRHRSTNARLAAILPVHLFGRACDVEGLRRVAARHRLRIIEDAAQAIGCRRGGVSVGRFGDAGCFSFYPTKNLGGPGDGGLVVTDDVTLAARLSRLRTHGGEAGSYEHAEVGINARMSELVAAVLVAKLARLDAWTARRRQIARLYSSGLAASAGQAEIVLPSCDDDESHVWHQYAVRVPSADGSARRRESVRTGLEERGIATRVFYPLPLHRQPCFAGLAHATPLPEADAAAAEVLCLPIYPSLTDDLVVRVTEAITDAVSRA
jgi:dTDP-4-amino-4,6-dideoxygalactose transaminase